MTNAREPVEAFFRSRYGQAVASLVRAFGISHLESIEEAVQDAMLTALVSWGAQGAPANPGGWIYTTARLRLIDRLRHLKMASEKTGDISRLYDESTGFLSAYFGREVPDDDLRLLFVCCDERLEPRTRLMLALKILLGFSVKEIALRLFMKEDAVKKAVSRGKKSLAALVPDMETPTPKQLEQRLSSVLHVIYLLFNEGYSSSVSDEPIRADLCEEAIRLAASLCAHEVATGDCWALLGLMHLHHARVDARFNDRQFVPLSEQRREDWSQQGIVEGMLCLLKVPGESHGTRYHLEAAILVEHCRAPTYGDTDWEEILRLYALLERVSRSPLHVMSRAIALAEWKGATAGLEFLDAATPPGWVANYYLWDETLGELCRRTGDFDRAHTHLVRALGCAPTEAERDRISERLARCEQP